MVLKTNLCSFLAFPLLVLTLVVILLPAALALQVQQTTAPLYALPKPTTIPFGIRLAFADPIKKNKDSSLTTPSLTVTWSTTAPLSELPCVELYPPASAKTTQQYLHFNSRRQGPATNLPLEKQPKTSNNDASPVLICGTSSAFIEPEIQTASQFIHTVLLDNLIYDETLPKYQYKCGNDVDGWSKQHSFRPPLPSGRDGSSISSEGGNDNNSSIHTSATNFLLLGDMGVAHALTLPALIKEATQGTEIFSTLLHVGDIAYDLHHYQGRKGQHFLRMIEPISSTIPYMVAPGNHEAAFNFSHYRSFFKSPNYENSENLYYSFDMGLVHIVVYNTEVFFWPESFGQEHMKRMFEWLEEDLNKANKNRKNTPWIIAVGHRPMYCSSVPQSGKSLSEISSKTPLSERSGNSTSKIENENQISALKSSNSRNFEEENYLEFAAHCGWEAEASRRGIPSICPHNNPRFCHRARNLEGEKAGAELIKNENLSPAPATTTFPIEELFKKYSVDMFIAGHVHDYERYWPVYNYTYTTYNNSGKKERTDNPEQPPQLPSQPSEAERALYRNPNSTVHIISGAGGNSEMRIGPGLPPQGPCSAETPWCVFQSGHGPTLDQGYDFSYSKVYVHNASHLQWQQVSVTFEKVVDEFWVVQDRGVHRFS